MGLNDTTGFNQELFDATFPWAKDVQEIMSGSSSLDCASIKPKDGNMWVVFPDGFEVKYEGQHFKMEDFKEHFPFRRLPV